MGVMKMRDGLKSAAMECGAPSMLEAGMFTMLPLSAVSLDISSTHVSFSSVVHAHNYTVPLLSDRLIIKSQYTR
jgi:hypothetical protein